MNKKGMTSIELLVSFVIISFVSIGMFSAVIDLLDKMEVYQRKINMTVMKGNITNSIQKDLKQRKLYGYTSCGTNCYDFTYQDGTTKRLKIDLTEDTVLYGGISEKVPASFEITGNMTFTKSSYTTAENKNNSILKIYIPIKSNSLNINGDINIVHQYDSRTTNNSLAVSANVPSLAPGMTPIKWNGSSWLDTTADDPNWYSYDIAEKKWANARTADGSMWVWIPRYIYKISKGWHSTTTGIIEVQFSKGTNDNWNSAVIGNINTDTTANASNNKWTNHPAFTFGTTELTGIWVAKFEPSVSNTSSVCYTSPSEANCNVTTLTPKSVPNVSSWRYISISNAFTVTRNMETNSVYGWGTSGSGIDTHLVKDVEWGAAAYLTQSVYGKNANVWINNSSTMTTGCAGNSADEAMQASCINAYNTAKGVQASSTGNIYGIYDMSGGSFERLSAYVNNGNASLSTYASTVVSANEKYKTVFTVGSPDNAINNYAMTVNKKGNIFYEVSNASAGFGYYGWNGDYSVMALTDYPCPIFGGGYYGYGAAAGIFAYDYSNGSAHSLISFRPILLVGAGL